MNYRLVTTAVAAGGLVIFSAFALLGQSKSNFTAPKHAFDKDHPSLEGIWQAKASAGDDVEKLLVGDKKLPYAGKAMDKQKENAKNKAKADPLNHCWMPGVPRMVYMNYPFQIFQTAKYINFVSEYAHVYRQVFMDDSKHIDDWPGGFWLGDSRGRWDGDTLAVDVVDFNNQTWFDKAGNYHSDKLHVEERYTRTAPDVLTYEATITDPEVYSKPWKISVPLALHKEPNFRLLEHECQDQGMPAAASF
jgi:hypothetical protein